MPGGDGTGPTGRGSMSGWGRGVCGRPGAIGRALNRDERGGRGRRNRFWSAGSPGWMPGASTRPSQADSGRAAASESKWLEEHLADLEAEQENIRTRLDELRGSHID